MGHKAESAHVGSKFLPICDIVVSGSTIADYGSDRSMNRKRRAISRMRDLIRWYAAANSGRGGIKRWKVPYFHKKGNLKDPSDEMSSTSSKISFTLDVGSCSAYSLEFSPLSLAYSTTSYRTFTNPNFEIDSEETCVSPKTEECKRRGIGSPQILKFWYSNFEMKQKKMLTAAFHGPNLRKGKLVELI
ncbi:uncharacterized protein LOC143892154 [Tasmannia lanceolata]|uniref:uncharacterized protein LOC143892154 n=1 Tax=Tasmannia lanceolata TaxID=3420 RepID=UPI004063E7E0